MAMVGPDGRLWVTAVRPEGLGGEDQYVSERDANGDWGPLLNLGEPMNTPGNDRCGDWTPDGKFFVFSASSAPSSFSFDIYFVNFEDLLESLGLSRIAVKSDKRDLRTTAGTAATTNFGKLLLLRTSLGKQMWRDNSMSRQRRTP